MMVERMDAWQCIGCGRIEGARPCVGICQDRRTEFVYAADYDAAQAQYARDRERAAECFAVLRQLAYSSPRDEQWERNYRALQARARVALERLAQGERALDAV